MSMFKKEFSDLPKTANLSGTRNVFLTRKDVKILLNRELDLDQKHRDEDEAQVFIMANLWCAVFQDKTGFPGEKLAERLRFGGLSATINEALSYKEYLTKMGLEIGFSDFWCKIFPVFVPECTTVLSFMRRLRLAGKETVSEKLDFLTGNIKCKNHNIRAYDKNGLLSYDEYLTKYTWTPGFLLDYAREIFTVIFESWKQDTSLFILPPGVTVEGAHTYLEKFEIVCDEQYWLRERGVVFNYPLPFEKQKLPVNSCRYNLVPKSFKSRRGIAPEPVAKQVLGYQVDSGLRECLRSFYCDLTDQTRNQEFSSDFKNATRDLTAASDSISLFLVEQLSSKLENGLRERLMDVRSEYVIVDGNRYKNYRYATMGNAVTFAIETAIFLTLAILSVILRDDIKLNPIRLKTQLRRIAKRIAVYGDDVVIPNEYCDVFDELCEKFGFKVNPTKSFDSSDPYRESCGKEWALINGQVADVTGTILPRGTSHVVLPELVSLQHKLVDCPTANTFLCSVILDVFPEITTSSIGSPYYDIWYDNPLTNHKGSSPYALIEEDYSIEYIDYGLIDGGKLRMKKDNKTGIGLFNFTNTSKEKEPIFVQVNKDFLCRDFYDRMNVILAKQYPDRNVKFRRLVSFEYHIVRHNDLVSIPFPYDENYEVHTMVCSYPGGKIPKDKYDKVELLAYLMTLGRGIEHVNSSPYTKDEDMILDRRDLCHKRKIQIKNKLIVD